ncbi:hypothetical protein M3Y97_00905300 [Aphelenchoides bicaudatus]|nr:hypothetical protein M3Y97_00905300 [Aphelenchoides bicaudatus]
MPSTIDNPGCKRVKFKSVAQPSTSTQNGSKCIEQQKLININDNCLPSFMKSCNLLILLLLVLSCYSAKASAIDDLYRSRAKRHTSDETAELSVTRQDTVCNQGGTSECVCNRSLGNLDDRLLICDRLLEEKQLTVISMVMRNINLDVKLHTNEPYQQYFRRRIANIVSQYCEHKANECPGAILSLNRNNVIILRVNYLTPQKTEIQLVVAKESMSKKLTDATLIDPKKVKDILLSQLAPLSRVLGGVQIEKLRLVEIDKRKAVAQNNGLD